MQKRTIVYIIVIIIILVFVFLSQQAYSRSIGKTLISNAQNRVSAYLTKGANLVMPNISSKIGQGMQSGGASIQNSISQGEKKISDAEKNIQNYFSGIKNAVEGKSSNSCATPPATTKTN